MPRRKAVKEIEKVEPEQAPRIESVLAMVKISDIVVSKQFDRFESKANKEEFQKGIIELADSIRENGLLTNVTLVPQGKKYLLRAGNRRLMACKFLGWQDIPATILPDSGLITLVENIQKQNMTGLELGDGLIEAMEILKADKPEADQKVLMEMLAKKIGKSTKTIYDYMKVSRKATDEERAAVKAGKLSTRDLERAKRKTGSRKIDAGKELKQKAAKFYKQVDSICESLKFIAGNATEFSSNKEFEASFKKLHQFVEITANEVF